MPKISIVVPVYRVEKYIARCIDSILNQTIGDIELILVNDCAPDDSKRIIQNYAAKDSRIVFIDFSDNKGPMLAREAGYLAACGDYIGFCDGDDALPLDALENLYNMAISSKADIVCGDLSYITTHGIRSIMRQRLQFGGDKVSVYKSLLLGELYQSLCGKLFKRELLQTHKYLNYPHFTNGEDGFLLYQVLSNCNLFSYNNIPVYDYYQNTESSSQVRLSELAIRNIVIINKGKVEICSPHPELDRYLYRAVSNIFNSLSVQGYKKWIRKYAEEYGMDKYISIYVMYHYFGLIELSKILIKRLKP